MDGSESRGDARLDRFDDPGARHLDALDGVRGLAALIVVVSHYSHYSGALGGRLDFGAGQIGVMLFFVLSGFLMGHLYFDARLDAGNLRRFWVKRTARVLPLYFAVVLASFLVNAVGGEGMRSSQVAYGIDATNLWEHLLLLEGVSVLWTIPVEVSFYLCFPVFWWARKYLGKSGSTVLHLILILGILAAVAPNPLSGSRGRLLEYGHYFLAGLVVSGIWLKLPARLPRVFNLLFVALSAGLLASYPLIQHDLSRMIGGLIGVPVQPFVPAFGNAEELLRQTLRVVLELWRGPELLAICSSYVLVCLLSPWAVTIYGSQLPRFFGTISYSVYLLHMPCHRLLELVIDPRAQSTLFAVCFFPMTVAAGWLSFRFFESPVREKVNARWAKARSEETSGSVWLHPVEGALAHVDEGELGQAPEQAGGAGS